MYPQSFLCEEAKIKQRTPLKKELCEIGEKAIWESRFTSFCYTNWEFAYELFANLTSQPSQKLKLKLKTQKSKIQS